jgi:endoglucanase
LKNGLRLIDSARFGRWGLPPDWLALTDPLTPASEFPTRYGYEAVRIPLYLYWAGLDRAERIAPFRALSAHFRGASFLPPWVDLGDDSVSSHDAAQGLRAVYLLVDPDATTALPPLGTDEDYYSASLLLLAKLAQRERAAR